MSKITFHENWDFMAKTAYQIGNHKIFLFLVTTVFLSALRVCYVKLCLINCVWFTLKSSCKIIRNDKTKMEKMDVNIFEFSP